MSRAKPVILTAAPDVIITLTAVQEDLTRTTTMQEVMTVVRSAARAVARADGATFVLHEGDLCYYADEDAISPLWKGCRFSANTCVSGWAMRHQETVVITDIYMDIRIPIDVYRPTFVRSLAMVPVVPVHHATAAAAIGAYWAHVHTARPEQINALQALADSTGVALARLGIH